MKSLCLWTDTRVGAGISALREGAAGCRGCSDSFKQLPAATTLAQTVAIRQRLQILWLRTQAQPERAQHPSTVYKVCTLDTALPLYCTTPHPFKFALMLCHENTNG